MCNMHNSRMESNARTTTKSLRKDFVNSLFSPWDLTFKIVRELIEHSKKVYLSVFLNRKARFRLKLTAENGFFPSILSSVQLEHFKLFLRRICECTNKDIWVQPKTSHVCLGFLHRSLQLNRAITSYCINFRMLMNSTCFCSIVWWYIIATIQKVYSVSCVVH